jgi:mono/diheme cytochrome c family protein
VFAAALALSSGAALAQNFDTESPDEMPGDGEGKWIVQSWCAACHSLNMVKQQGMSRKRWDETLVWMVEKQGMPEMPDDARDIVLDYLAEHFGEDHRPGNALGTPMSTGLGLAPLMPPPQ